MAVLNSIRSGEDVWVFNDGLGSVQWSKKMGGCDRIEDRGGDEGGLLQCAECKWRRFVAFDARICGTAVSWFSRLVRIEQIGSSGDAALMGAVSIWGGSR